MSRLPAPLGAASLALLAACNFVVGSGAMALTGLVAPIALDLGVGAAAAAQLLTAYALAFALGAPVVALLASRVCRKTLLVAALAAFGVLMIAGALAPGFGSLVGARAATGLGAAAFVPNAAAVAAALALPAQRGRALTVVFGGFTAALVLGAPLGTALGQAWGWRWLLGGLGVAALLLALGARRGLPGGIRVPGATAAAFAAVLRQRRLLALLALNALGAFGSFVVFGLASVAFPALLPGGAGSVATGLLVFGLGALAGNALSVVTLDRVGAAAMGTASMLAAGLALGLLALAPPAPLAWAALALWGVASFVATTALQTRLVALAPPLASALLPLNSSAQFAGQSLGAVGGGLWLLAQPAAVAGLPALGAVALLLAAAGAWALGRQPAASALVGADG